MMILEGMQPSHSSKKSRRLRYGARLEIFPSRMVLPLLLESICSIFIPTLLGAHVHFDTGLAEQVGRGEANCEGLRSSSPHDARVGATDCVFW
jgi:hypothetical protein